MGRIPLTEDQKTIKALREEIIEQRKVITSLKHWINTNTAIDANDILPDGGKD